MRFLRLLFFITLIEHSQVIASTQNKNNEEINKAENRKAVTLFSHHKPEKSLKFSTEARSRYFCMSQIESNQSSSRWQFNSAQTTDELLIECVTHNEIRKLSLSANLNRGDMSPYCSEIIKIFLSKFANAGWIFNAEPYSDLAKILESLGFTTKGDKRYLECNLTYTRESKKILDAADEEKQNLKHNK